MYCNNNQISSEIIHRFFLYYLKKIHQSFDIKSEKYRIIPQEITYYFSSTNRDIVYLKISLINFQKSKNSG